jgi:hypothetical protein
VLQDKILIIIIIIIIKILQMWSMKKIIKYEKTKSA